MVEVEEEMRSFGLHAVQGADLASRDGEQIARDADSVDAEIDSFRRASESDVPQLHRIPIDLDGAELDVHAEASFEPLFQLVGDHLGGGAPIRDGDDQSDHHGRDAGEDPAAATIGVRRFGRFRSEGERARRRFHARRKSEDRASP